MNEIERSIRELARLRDAYAKESAYLDSCQAKLAATPEQQAVNAAIWQTLKTDQLITDDEKRLRGLVLGVYREDQNKRPLKGITIKIFKRIKYDAAQAEAWCRQNAPTLFKFDAKAFEKAAEKLPGAPVTVEDDPRVTLASDLSEYLHEAEARVISENEQYAQYLSDLDCAAADVRGH